MEQIKRLLILAIVFIFVYQQEIIAENYTEEKYTVNLRKTFKAIPENKSNDIIKLQIDIKLDQEQLADERKSCSNLY